MGGVLYETKNGVHNPIAQNIENFQVEYNGDFNAARAIGRVRAVERYSGPSTEVSCIRQVRVQILGRTARELRQRFGPPDRQHPSLSAAGPLQFRGQRDGRPAAPFPAGIDVQYPEPVLEYLQSRRAVKQSSQNCERGSSLIVVIMIVAFMLAVGVALLTITGTAPKASGSVRNQEEAFDAAEAGFDAARIAVESNFFDGLWTNLPDNCLQTPAGIDLPYDPNYFRKKTDAELVADPAAGGIPLPTATNGVIFKDQPFIKNADRRGRSDPDVHGLSHRRRGRHGARSGPGPLRRPHDLHQRHRSGNRILSTSRLEILIGIQVAGDKSLRTENNMNKTAKKIVVLHPVHRRPGPWA